MKKLLFILLFALISNLSFSLDASITYATFKVNDKNLVEIYLHIVSSTVEFIAIDSNSFSASVEVLILFYQNEEIVNFEKYNMKSPVGKYKINFIDQKRFLLENGEYDLEVTLKDANNSENIVKYKKSITLNYNSTDLQQSDIQLLSSLKKSEENTVFTKNGYFLEALPFNYYGKNASILSFYSEIYNSDKTIKDDYAIRYYIESTINDKKEITVIGHKRQKPQPVNVLLVKMDISQLKSGNYNLVVEIRNRNNKLLSTKSIYFQRSNPFLNINTENLTQEKIKDEFVNKLSKKEVLYSLKALAPTVDNSEMETLNSIIKKGDTTTQKFYLFSYWARKNPNNPKHEYLQYMTVAKAVDEHFKSGFGYGFETDRGHIFMKYGKPNNMISVENDPVAPPYEIWAYTSFPATNQTNVKFIFYNRSLSPGDYRLLHSTARGEINNPRWEIDLYYNAPNETEGSNYIDGTRMKDNYMRNARKYFDDL